MYIPKQEAPFNATKGKSIKNLVENECVRINSQRELVKINTYYPQIAGIVPKNGIYFYPKIGKIFEQKQHIFDKVYFLEELFEFQVTNYTRHNKSSEFSDILKGIQDLLDYKNSNYGNAALEPLDIFSGKCKVGQRIDDKLARIKNAKELRKNDLADIIGYLVLTCKEKGWDNFDDLKD